MPRVPYVGINDKAKKVKKMYIGVDGKARKVLKAYVGVNGIARIFYTADWWVPYGLNESNCIAAWQFYKAKNQSTANIDITGHGYNVFDTRYATWNQNSGYYLNDFMGTSPSVGSAVTGVFWYTGMSTPSMGGINRGKWLHAYGGRGMHMAAKIGRINRYVNGEWVYTDYPNRAGFCFNYDFGSNHRITGYIGNSDTPVSGVIAFDRSKPQIYINGNAIGVTYINLKAESNNNSPSENNATFGPHDYYLRAAAFFNCGLTARQHSDIAKAITEIK